MTNDVKYLLFSSPFCVACRPVKDFMNKTSIKGEQIDASEETGSNLAIKYSVTSLPTIIFLDGQNEMARFHNVNEVREFITDELSISI